MKAILAENYKQYLYWCRENKCSPQGRDYFYISDILSLKGLHGFEVVKIGTWYTRPDIEKIEKELIGRM